MYINFFFDKTFKFILIIFIFKVYICNIKFFYFRHIEFLVI